MSNPTVQIIITLTGDAAVEVSGPVGNKILCYGMLALAEDAIRNFQPGQEKSRLLVPVGTLPR